MPKELSRAVNSEEISPLNRIGPRTTLGDQQLGTSSTRDQGMSTGTVTTFLEDRGFGFIRPADGGADVFVHVRDVSNRDVLRTGERVEFDIVTDDRSNKPRADRVRVI
jgi:cold shock CspA family protein